MARPRVTVPAIAAALVLCVIAMAKPSPTRETKSKRQKQAFGRLQDGQAVDLYRLTNTQGMEVAITNYGATLVRLKVPDRQGKLGDVVLGYDNVAGYEGGKAYFGATVGRYANRIAHASFALDGVTYTLAKNDGDNHLHGGFNKRVWTAKDVSASAGEALELTYLSKDGEEGYPGNLSVKVVYTLLAGQNALKIDYTATTDKATVINLVHHSYFNLAGQGNGDILQHQLTIHASRFTPVDATLIPTGELLQVRDTPFDFLQPAAIGARINQDDQQLKLGKGYDHNFVLDRESPDSLSAAAQAYDPQSGRVLEISTTEPGIQFYTGNFLDGISGKDGKSYNNRYAFCLETQHFPDSPNHPDFPSTVLKPGQRFRSTTIYKFSTR
jgi:aldose 1-epimerase